MVTIGDLENNEIESIHIEGITNIPLIKGEQGKKGDKGYKGETNNIKIGTVETGEKASATLEGESPNQILNLVLPKGDKGEQGEPGIKPVKGIDYFTEEEIQEIKSNILDQVNQFSVLVVEELPNDNIDEHTIYFVPKTKTEQNDVYDEFIYINNGWEHIGTTEVDLSSYYKKDEIDTKLEAVEGNEVFVGNEKEAPSSAKIIVEEDDFVEGSTLGKAEVYVGAEEPTTGEKVWFNKNKNSIYVRNSNGVYEELYNKEQINTLINRSSVGYSEVLYSDSTGVVAGSAGNAVILSKSVSNYAAILVVHQKGSCVVNNKLNTQNYGYGINIHWFNEGLAGTFYDNTVYKVVGLCKL